MSKYTQVIVWFDLSNTSNVIPSHCSLSTQIDLTWMKRCFLYRRPLLRAANITPNSHVIYGTSTLHIFRKPNPRILSFCGKPQAQREELSTIFLEVWLFS